MNGFNDKISKESVARLCAYITDKDMERAHKITAIYAYCNALYDIGILTLNERIETAGYCVKKLFEMDGLI